MNFINKLKNKYIDAMSKKGVDRVAAKKLAVRFVSVTLSFILAVSAIVPVLAGISFDTFAEEPVFGRNYLDTSSGTQQDGWFQSSDPRYVGASGALGSETNPYIIKNGDELYSLSLKVESGRNFNGEFIDLIGLSKDEADKETQNAYIMANTIDLRAYSGTTSSATADLLWVPIGSSVDKSFEGNIFSSTGVSIVNLTYHQRGYAVTGKAYGLFGYNSGTIGIKGETINVSAMQYATEAGTPKDLDFTINRDSNGNSGQTAITSKETPYIGGVVAINTGTVKNVSFGTGSFCEANQPTKKEVNHVYTNGIKTPKNDSTVANNLATGFSVGGIVGYNNGGTVSDCSFTGQIYAVDENINGTAKYDDEILKSGFGGIVGFAENGTIENCFSNGNIEAGSASYSAFGGIVGNARGTTGTVKNCVFTGKVDIGVKYANTVQPTSVGGIAGLAGGFNISQCVSGGSVTAKIAGNGKDVPVGGTAAGIVGRTSLNSATNISESFSLGTISSGFFAGGIVGANGNNTTVSDSFSTATIKVLNAGDQKAEFSVETSTGSTGFGGLEGGTSFDGGSTTNSYFAGTTLSSEIGSLFGLKNNNRATNVYFDSAISPNNGVTKTGKTGEFDGTTARKTTNDFLSSGSVALSDKFTKQANAYPELTWVNVLAPTTNLEKTIKALSKVATTITFQANGTNSVANGTEYNAYQMKKDKIDNSVFDNVVADSNIGLSESTAWVESIAFKGEYDTGNIGGVFTSTVKVQCGDISTEIELSKKLIKAVNQTEGSANNISKMEDLQALLDVSRNASGAYTGSVFTFTDNISGKLTAPSARTIAETNDTNREINNLFCGELNGGDKTIEEIVANGSFTSMFGTSFFAKVHNLKFGTVTLGTATDNLTLVGKYNALLISRAKGTDFSAIDFGTVSADMTVSGKDASFGMLTSYLETPGGYSDFIKDIIFDSVIVKMIDIYGKDNLNYGLVCAIGQFGDDGDSSKKTEVQVLSDITVNDYILRIGDYSTSSGRQIRTQALGGLFGMFDVYNGVTTNDIVVTENCFIKNIEADIDIYECNNYINKSYQGLGFGGITAWSKGGFSNCHVTGKIIGPAAGGSSVSDRAVIGGITASGNSGGFFRDSSFVGDIDGVIVGGIVGKDIGVSSIINCYSQAEINEDISINSTRIAKKDQAGGLVGFSSPWGGIKNMTNCFFEGAVSGTDAGGIVGKSNGGVIQNSYVKAIIYSMNSAGSAGGLIGNATADMNITNSYFAGQVTGAGSAGGLIGKGNVTSAQQSKIKTSFFDRGIAGENIPTIPALTETEQEIVSELDKACAVESIEITKSAMNTAVKDTSPYIEATQTNYPQIEAFANSLNEREKKLSNESTQIVFSVDAGSFLTSKPNFELKNDMGNAYSVDRNETTDGVYIPWDEVLNYAPGGNVSPYGTYTMGPKGDTYFTVKYNNFYGNNSLDMKYNISVKPFDYGKGTATEPYIIYNNAELIKYREYLKNGFDTSATYYKIGSVDVKNNKILGLPITLDLSEYPDWEPIVNASGHLDGNNSVIKNITCTEGYKYKDDSDRILDTYFGFFGSSTHTSDIKDLTLDNVKINADNGAAGIKAGAFMGTSSGGSFTNIVVTNSSINYSGNLSNSTGGLIGHTSLTNSTNLNIDQCAVYGDLNINNEVRTNVGGLVGYVSGGNTKIENSATYGTIKNGTNVGGVIGHVSDSNVTISGTSSTVDLTTSVPKANVGGITGFSSSKNLSTTITDSLYGGRIISTGQNSNMGGMIGYGNVYENYVGQKTFDSEDVISFFEIDVFNDESDIETFISDKVNEMNGGNFYYNYDTNPYPTANIEFTGEFHYLDDKGDVTRGSKKYSDTNGNVIVLGKTTTGKSNTYAMTQKQLTFSDPTMWTDLDKGYFPRPSWLKTDTDNSSTQRDELYLNDMSMFYSTAVYYTNAGKAGDEKLSNVFVTGDDASWSGQKTSDADKAKITANKKMILATDEGANQNFELTQTVHSFTFKKPVVFTPSIIPCGVEDFSFYFANPQGMWVEDAKNDDETVSYPWTIYTADQLRGIDRLLKSNNGVFSDGNGLELIDIKYDVAPPSGSKIGETFTLGADIAGHEKVDGVQYGYTEFLPIGNVTNPFNTTFNGLGHTVRNLALSPSEEHEMGIFGTIKNAEISNLGIAPYNIEITGECVVGGIVAQMAGNSSIINSFSSLTLTNKNGSTANVAVGGLVGKSSGAGNSITNSFNTGAIYLTSDNSVAGGLVGTGTGMNITNSYIAGYIEAKKSGVISGEGAVTATNCYYDIGATGNMAISNNAISQMPTAKLLGNSFNDETGLYPVQKLFSSNLTDYVKVSTIPVSLTNARSVTSGSVSFDQASISYFGKLGDYNSVGTITLSADNKSFEKNNTGIAFLGVNYNELSRTVVANLQCWYDAGISNDNNFVINTAKELAEFAQIVNGTLTPEGNPNGNHGHDNITNKSFEGWTVSLGSDIDLSSFPDWISIGTNDSPFKGTFDGAGHVVSNFSQTTANKDGNTGIFGTVSVGEITNFGVASGDSSGGTLAGGIVANSVGAIIKGCFNGSSVNGVKAGGLVGKADGNTSIVFSYNMGVVSGTEIASGIVATNDGAINSSYNTGIIRAGTGTDTTTGTGAGIFASGIGTAIDCYNASYVTGATLYPVAPSGTSTCSYDNNLLSYTGSVSGVTAKIERQDDNTWVASSDEKYPELKYFAEYTATMVMQDASELSVLKMNFGSGNYLEFVEAKLFGSVTTSDDRRLISLASVNNIFNISQDGDSWRIEPSAQKGSDEILAGISSTVKLEHRYFAFAVVTMKVRYKFDFKGLFNGTPTENSNYRGDKTSSTNTWADAGTTHTISTPDDLIKFANYANSKETKGHTFVLDYSIDMQGQTLPMIGSESKPFEGTFDGGFYTISNLDINGIGNVAMFGTIGITGRVLNFKLNNFSVTAEKSASEMVVASIAANNMGLVQNIGINEGKLMANNASSSQETYLGSLVAKNSGKIRGCYFIQKRSDDHGIVHSSASGNQFVGGMVGDNTGSITGCYLISNMLNNNIKAIAGNNHGKTDNILNCYFNVQGVAQPSKLSFAYDDVPWKNFYVSEPHMKTKEFATWLSSNLYAGTFEQGTVGEFIGSSDITELNDGLPYLALFELAKYDVGSYFNEKEKSIMLSVWNITDDADKSFGSLNGLFAVDSLEYKYFNSIIVRKNMQFDMTLIQRDIGYEISTRIYGKGALYGTDVDDLGTLIPSSANARDIAQKAINGPLLLNIENVTSGMTDPNLIVATIKFKKEVSSEMPWGNYRIDTN